MKQHRHANYTLSKALNEFVDNIIKKTDEIHIYTQVDDTQKLQEIKISDNYSLGFENLDCDGIHNPFNMGHIKVAHDDDSETSEFGVGMKAGALSAANQLNVYTKIKNMDGTYKYIEVICDFIRMSNEMDVNASYNPKIKCITYEEYREQHPFDFGSTLKLSKIRDCIYSKTTIENITKDISNKLSDTYSRFISNGSKIAVNGNYLTPAYDFFEDPKCTPFMITKDVFILENSGMYKYIIRKNKDQIVWQEYNSEIGKWFKMKEYNDGLVYIEELKNLGYKFVYSPIFQDGTCMQISTIFTFYSDKYHTKSPKSEPDLPEDSVYIYKDDRNYGKQSLLKHNNGIHNYTQHEIDFISKRLGKDIGITFNKEILLNGTNDIILVIKAALIDSREDFTADTSVNKNALLCEKAIKKGLIDLLECPEAKLSATHRVKRATAKGERENIVSIPVSIGKKIKPIKKLHQELHIETPQEPLNDSIQEPIKEVLNESLNESLNDSLQKPIKELLNESLNESLQEPINESLQEPIKEPQDDIKDNQTLIEIYNHRKTRIVRIIDCLTNSKSRTPDDILSEDIIELLEKIFTNE
jgi:hypothetical protein